MEGSYHEIDDWTSGEAITSQEKLKKIAEALDRTAVIVEHRHYRGGRAPTRIFFDDYGEFLAYLNENAKARRLVLGLAVRPLHSSERHCGREISRRAGQGAGGRRVLTY